MRVVGTGEGRGQGCGSSCGFGLKATRDLRAESRRWDHGKRGQNGVEKGVGKMVCIDSEITKAAEEYI